MMNESKHAFELHEENIVEPAFAYDERLIIYIIHTCAKPVVPMDTCMNATAKTIMRYYNGTSSIDTYYHMSY